MKFQKKQLQSKVTLQFLIGIIKKMMLSDPWDLKHEIQQLQQQQQQSKKLIIKNQFSSLSTTFKDDDISDIDHLPPSKSKSKYLSQSEDYYNEIEIQSEENSIHEQQQIAKKSINGNDSLDVKESQISNVQFVQLKRNKNRKKYGNLIVFCQTSRSFLSIGPNYLFFAFAYVCFTMASIYLVKLVNQSLENVTFKIFNLVFCLLQNISYLLVAFSNPGVQLPSEDILMSSSEIKDNRICKKCGALQQRKTYHCRQCDICVKDYDHHCPWTSKCIGGGNLRRFYLFVGVTPFYIFYYVITFMICMANLAIGQNTHLKNQAQAPPKL